MYKAKNVDTDKALAAIEKNRHYFEQLKSSELNAIDKYYAGIQRGLDMAEELFTCSNHEKQAIPYNGPAESQWVMAEERGLITCKNCGREAARHPNADKQWETPYCPCCGAKMIQSIILKEANNRG